MDNAAFQLKSYRFGKITIDIDSISGEESIDMNLGFKTSGLYDETTGDFRLKFQFSAKTPKGEEVVDVVCSALFKFAEPIAKQDIPDFFYPNSIAIIFPYVRAMVSTITLMANIRPLVLPTMNLSSLRDELKTNTETIGHNEE